MGVFSELDIMFHNGASSDRIARFIMSVNHELEYKRALKLAKHYQIEWNRGEEE